MISITTNLGSMIVQNSLNKATLGLNNATERMTTGYKINHAKDNAANYSINTNLSTKISSFMVAEDNVAMGLDLLTTASDSLNQIDDKLTRLRALAEQAANGTYGEDSLKAINSEANAIVDEIERLYGTTSYNGINLFGEEVSGFIEAVSKRDTSSMAKFSEVDVNATSFTESVYSISTAEELAQLATMTNNGVDTSGVEFVLANDIDLSKYSLGEGWVTIGIYDNDNPDDVSKAFRGDFDGNGFTISGLSIEREAQGQGLFSYIYQATIKNVALKNVNVTAVARSAGLVGVSKESEIYNSSVEGEVFGYSERGLLFGRAIQSTVDKCYVVGNLGISSYNSVIPYNVGGLGGNAYDNSIIKNSFSKVDINNGYTAGGLLGKITNGLVENCYSTGKISGGDISGGGFLGSLNSSSCQNCYVDVDIINLSSSQQIGAFVGGASYSTISNCSVLSKAKDAESIFIGWCSTDNVVENSYYNLYYEEKGLPYMQTYAGSLTTNNVQSCDGTVPYEYQLNYADTNKPQTSLQVGIDSNKDSQISFQTGFSLHDLSYLRDLGKNPNTNYLLKLDNLLSRVSAKQTEYGAAQNRLESAMEQISVSYENLVSSQSTIRDADIAKESSEFIRNQILQQAAATLMATANQTPAIALQLI